MIDVVVSDPIGAVIGEVLEYIDAHPSQDVHISLTGGRAGNVITQQLLELLGHNRFVHLWWSDERFVPRGHLDRTAPDTSDRELECHIHAIPSSDEVADVTASAAAYAATLHKFTTTRFCSDNTLMDICILSIGPDGHVASLFPHHDLLDSTAGVASLIDSPKPPAERVTWTYPTINASREVWLVASGSEKAEAVAALRHGADFHDIPAAGVHGKLATRLFTDISPRTN